MIIQLIALILSMVNTSIPVSDCNVYISNSHMMPGYARDYTVYSDDCVLDYSNISLVVFEDASFTLTFVDAIPYKLYMPLVNSNEHIENAGHGFRCEFQSEGDHGIIFCESENVLFPEVFEQVSQLTALDKNTFSGCISFGSCNK